MDQFMNKKIIGRILRDLHAMLGGQIKDDTH